MEVIVNLASGGPDSLRQQCNNGSGFVAIESHAARIVIEQTQAHDGGKLERRADGRAEISFFDAVDEP